MKRVYTSFKWVIFSLITGLVVGFCGTVFYLLFGFVNIMRTQNPWLLYLMPIAGLAIVALYHIFKDDDDGGTNLVISSIHSGEKIPFRMAPLVFISTLLTHLCGGSASHEGAALQIGGSIGNALGKAFHFDEKDTHIMIMCGMSAAFAAVFGTPMAAAIFSMELISVGVMHYSALVPCVIGALVGQAVANRFGCAPQAYTIARMSVFRPKTAVAISILAILCALVSILFCVLLHSTERFFQKYLKNAYLRAFVGGCILVGATLLLGDAYSGTGTSIIAAAFEAEAVPYDFLLKMIFTAVCLGVGFKGGEILPAMACGASFGCLFGTLLGFNPPLCAAVGMIALFCGVTNCPVTALLLAFEMFGYEGMPYFLLTVAFSYMLSGYFGLYHSQRIVYSKYKTNYINKSTL